MPGKRPKISFRVVVDRIEERRWAVLSVPGGGRMTLPVKLFRGQIHEGQTFDVSWRADPRAEKQLKSDVAALQKALLRRSAHG